MKQGHYLALGLLALVLKSASNEANCAVILSPPGTDSLCPRVLIHKDIMHTRALQICNCENSHSIARGIHYMYIPRMFVHVPGIVNNNVCVHKL